MKARFLSPNRFFLACECIFLFFIIPTLGVLCGSKIVVLSGLLAMIGYAIIILSQSKDFSWHKDWRGRSLSTRELKIIILRFLISLVGLIMLIQSFIPEKLFHFPAHKPILWALVMFLYPIASALPQEILYRSFFFNRYKKLFPKKWEMMLVGSVAFGFAHIVFLNLVSPFLCVLCGYYLSSSYYTHRSLKRVAIEHALYGNMVFTIGLGYYFIMHT